MKPILQHALPPDMVGEVALPGVAPCGARDWLRVDEVYAAQMAYRAKLLAEHKAAVLWMAPAALEAAREVLSEALKVLRTIGFDVSEDKVICPDGRLVAITVDDPLWTLGHLVQEDICILHKEGAQHVLTGAVLCFPANWRLADKAGRPLVEIHDPVVEYDANLARRVQRLFDGVRSGRPLCRFNRLTYSDPDLHQPMRKDEGRVGHYTRSERQCILRLPVSGAVIFTIHTWVVRD